MGDDQRPTEGDSRQQGTRSHYLLTALTVYVTVESMMRVCGTMVDADTINTFKSRLDKHCLNQDVVYNFYAELLTGTGGALN